MLAVLLTVIAVIIISVSILIAVMVLFRMPIRVKMQVRSGFTVLKVSVRPLFGCVRFNVCFRAVYTPGEGFYIAAVRGDGSIKRIVFPKAAANVKSFFNYRFISDASSYLKLRELFVFAKLGVGDAFYTVLACGALDIFLNAVADCLSYGEKKIKRAVKVVPDFNDVSVILNMEGIFHVVPTKIINIILKRKGRKYYASD